jgi:hypothetical protein
VTSSILNFLPDEERYLKTELQEKGRIDSFPPISFRHDQIKEDEMDFVPVLYRHPDPVIPPS